MRIIKTRKKKIHYCKKTRKTIKNNSYAGKAIGAGGYGCIFKPHIECKSNKHQTLHNNKSYVSKLMMTKYVKKEMSLINNVKKNVEKISNYENYFLVDGVYSCQPNTLKKRDLHGFNDKCKNLRERNITKKNINKRLRDVKIINLPYGGMDIDTYWKKWKELQANSPQEKKNKNRAFAVTNICLLQLLMKGILRMNLMHYYHLDIKGSNILRTVKKNITNINDVKTRLIDWGLATNYTDKSEIPSIIVNRPFQYNLPFSNILFQTELQKIINSYVKNYRETRSTSGKEIICDGLARVIFDRSIIKLGCGHKEYMFDLLETIYSPLYSNKKDIGKNIMCNYISKVLQDYTTENFVFEDKKYLKNVFLKNVDIWGFLMAYVDLITLKNPWKNKFQNIIVKVLTEYCFGTTYATQYIPIYPLVNELLKLNGILNQPINIKGYPHFTKNYVGNMKK